MKHDLQRYRNELDRELLNILGYWQTFTPDNVHGGFFGQIDQENNVNALAPKGSVLNSRILWTFSAAFNHYKNHAYLDMAKRAYDYLQNHFIDAEFGGAYWTVTAAGDPLDTKKQLYASAFALYATSEYYKASGEESAKQLSIDLYRTILLHGFDQQHGGFWEAFTREWKELSDQRLSSKDANEQKSMNTNLHVLEAFANLYTIWPDESLRAQIHFLLGIFHDKIFDRTSNHLHLFFTDNWTVRPDVISFGHDIEAAWLLPDASEKIHDETLTAQLKQMAVSLTDSSLEGVDRDGGLWYEYVPAQKKMILQKHWWPQAEAMVGFFNAWQLTGNEKYLDASLNSWHFTQQNILDTKNGEWHWGVNADGSPMENQDKVGLWKCPYHNSRACLEIIRRIGSKK